MAKRTGVIQILLVSKGRLTPTSIKPDRLIFLKQKAGILLTQKKKLLRLLSQFENNGVTIVKRSMSELVEQLNKKSHYGRY